MIFITIWLTLSKHKQTDSAPTMGACFKDKVMISYDQIRAEYRAKYRAYKLELIDELSAQRDALNFTFSDLLNSKRDCKRKREYLRLSEMIGKLQNSI